MHNNKPSVFVQRQLLRPDSLPSAALVASLGRHAQVRDMTDTGERFSAKAVCADGGQVLESADLGRREPLAENR